MNYRIMTNQEIAYFLQTGERDPELIKEVIRRFVEIY